MIRRALAALALALLAACGMGGTDIADWHADPATAERTGRPNDYMVAPPGATRALVNAASPVWAAAPDELMARLDRIALAEPRTRRLAGTPEALHMTWEQRSRVFGFPDYVSARAVAVEGGAALILWSRARYGYADFGVNRDRVERWLAALGPAN